MKKLALLSVFLALPIFAQSNYAFGALGMNILPAESALYSLGVGHYVRTGESVFVDVVLSPNSVIPGQATSVMVGFKQDLPAITFTSGTFGFHARPFMFAALGATLTDVFRGTEFQGATLPTSTSPSSIVAALGTAPRLTEQYGGGLLFHRQHFDWGLGARVEMVKIPGLGTQKIPQPYFLISKSF